MAGRENGFIRANDRFRQRAYQGWRQKRLKRQILRSQIGFAGCFTARPSACVGCQNYHGQAYGLQQARRVALICGLHPYGWQGSLPCPDWSPDENKTRPADGLVHGALS